MLIVRIVVQIFELVGKKFEIRNLVKVDRFKIPLFYGIRYISVGHYTNVVSANLGSLYYSQKFFPAFIVVVGQRYPMICTPSVKLWSVEVVCPVEYV